MIATGFLPKESVDKIFYKLEEILEGHLWFQIALHDKISNWDEHESLGGDFLENVGLKYIKKN